MEWGSQNYMNMKHEHNITGPQAGYMWTWWQGDTLPVMPPLAGWHVEMPEERALLLRVCDIDEKELTARWQLGHRAYFAYRERELVAFGWSAINDTAFGEPQVNFWVPPRNLYLYHFLTIYKWRGRGFYPRLLQEIIQRAGNTCERFWIIHQLSNSASQRGIAKAGFSIATSVYHTPDKQALLLVAGKDRERAEAGSRLLGLPLVTI